MWRHTPSVFDPYPVLPAGPPEAAPRRLPAAAPTAPDLVGLASTDARRAARRSGLFVEVEERPTAPELWGLVLQQQPLPGQPMEPEGILRLTVASRPLVTVPDVRGRDEDEALSLLREVGLGAVRRATRRSDRVPEGCIVRTRPRAGVEVTLGSSVTYVIAAGQRPVRRDRSDRRRRGLGRLSEGRL